MIRFPLFLLIGLFPLLSFSQNKETRDVSNFSKIYIGGAFNVYLSQGNSYEVIVEATSEDMENIVAEVSGNKLQVKTRKGARNVKGDIYLTFKDIDEIHSAGASNVKSETVIKAHNFGVKSSGAGEMSLELEVDDIKISSSGASTLTLSGKAGNQDISLSGAGSIKAFDLVGKSASITASGAGNIRVNVTGTLNVRSSGASSVRYKGSPEVESIKISGAGSVNKE